MNSNSTSDTQNAAECISFSFLSYYSKFSLLLCSEYHIALFSDTFSSHIKFHYSHQSKREKQQKLLSWISSLQLFTACYEHAWTDQSSDDAMPSLNLAHPYWTLRAILSTSSRCSALSSFISFIILLDKHIWHITSHLYRA